MDENTPQQTDVKQKKQRQPSYWMQALKAYNEGKGQYIIPKRGSAEYDEVKTLEAQLRGQN